MSKKVNKLKNNSVKKKNKKNPSDTMWTSVGIVTAVVIVLVVAIAALKAAFPDGFGKKSDGNLTAVTDTATETPQMEDPGLNIKEVEVMITEPVKVKVQMEKGGSFVMELYPEYAPQTVQNFVDLVEDGFYDGVGFHRVIDGFMAQGGDPDGNGTGGSGVNIVGEFAENGFPQNTLSHQRGVVSMARSQHPDSASSQFFICYEDASFLDGQYAAFGKVIEGMEVVDAFLEVERVGMEGGTPTEPIIMKTVTVID